MPNTRPFTSSGFASTSLVIVVALVLGSLIGLRVYKHAAHTSEAASSSARASAAPTDFASCVQKGGFVATDGLGTSTQPDPEGIYDRLVCYASNLRSGPSWVAQVQLCKPNDMCQYLPTSEIDSCVAGYAQKLGITVDPMTIVPLSATYPAIKDSFGRIQYEGCTSTATAEKLPGFVGYYKLDTAGIWQIIGLYFNTPDCKLVDNKGIPAEILYTCLSSNGTFRAPK